MSDEHYLKKELYELVRSDPAIFEFLQNGSLDGIWYWDLEEPETEWMSPRLWEVFGYAPETKQHLVSEWQSMIDPDDLQVALENFHKHLADPNHAYDQYVRYRHKDGSTVWVRCRGLAIRDKNGKPTRMLGAHTNVTALKLAEERVSRLASELKATNQELEGFAYSVSHDLRSPLRAIDGFTRILLEDHAGQLDDEGQRALGVIRKNVGRMAELIDDLLEFSRLGRKELKPSRIDMTALANEALEESAALEKDRAIETRIAELPEALGDPALLRQVWANLIGNAVKYTRGKSPAVIEVTGRLDSDEIVYSVKDDGIGFDMKYSDTLFGVFTRLHNASEFEGTGVGLALVQRIVARHGGRVWAEARLNEGATFHFALPRREG